MRIDVVQAGELSEDNLDAWRAIQLSSPDLKSPFFAPEFARIVATERNDTLVAVIAQDRRVDGFFPFHRGPDGAGMPAGMRISDFHGLIARDSPEWRATDLLRGCGLARWEFRAVPISQKMFQPWRVSTTRTVSIDLAEGLPVHSKRLEAPRRKLEKEIGEVRFTWHAGNPRAMERLLKCKSAQYRRTGLNDLFATGWVANVLMRLHAAAGSGCRGVLSELRAGDEIIAAHFGARSSSVLHYWFPCYWPAFARYSPGLILLSEIVRHAPLEGVSRIDLGFANASYKERFANAEGVVARGAVTITSQELAG